MHACGESAVWVGGGVGVGEVLNISLALFMTNSESSNTSVISCSGKGDDWLVD